MKAVALLAAGLLLVALGASAQMTPVWVSLQPSAGFINCAPTTTMAGASVPLSGLSLVEVSAETDTKISFWNYNGSSWAKINPRWGNAAGDTMIVIPAGTVKAFRFGSPYVKAIYLTSGVANFCGE